MIKEAIPQFDKLSVSEKLILLEELWDDLAARPEDIPLWDWQKEELDRRYEEYRKNPSEGSPWLEVKERLMRSL